MLYRTLGQTNLQVSLLGLGSGSVSAFAQAGSAEAKDRLLRSALELGINYIDTAPMYGDSEQSLGNALRGVSRERVILATKFFPMDEERKIISPQRLRLSVETSLQRLGVETVDVFQIHGVRPSWFRPIMESLGETLENLRKEGKFRFLGVAETIVEDPSHDMVPDAVLHPQIATALVGYSPLSPWAEVTALPACIANSTGVIAMVSTRRSLRDPAYLAERLAQAKARGDTGPAELSEMDPLHWLIDEHCPSLTAAAYRFAASHAAVATVLSATTNPSHLAANAAAICAPAMPLSQLERLRRIFLRTDPRLWILADL